MLTASFGCTGVVTSAPEPAEPAETAPAMNHQPVVEIPSTSIAACERWAKRKTRECKQTLKDTPAPKRETQSVLSFLTLYDQCILFDDRRLQVAECGAKDSCQELADCTVQLIADDWTPKTSPAVCDAVVRRHSGAARMALHRLSFDVSNTSAWWERLYGLHQLCTDRQEVRDGLAECLNEEDERFAACIVEIMESNQ